MSRGYEIALTPISYEQVTSLGSAVGITVPDGTSLVAIQAETQPVRWRDDGTNPTTSVGMIIAAGDVLWYTGKPKALKFIETAASAKLNVMYYR